MLGHWINIYNLCYHIVVLKKKLIKLLKIVLLGPCLGKNWASMGHTQNEAQFFLEITKGDQKLSSPAEKDVVCLSVLLRYYFFCNASFQGICGYFSQSYFWNIWIEKCLVDLSTIFSFRTEFGGGGIEPSKTLNFSQKHQIILLTKNLYFLGFFAFDWSL